MGITFYQAKEGWDKGYLNDKSTVSLHINFVPIKGEKGITLYCQISHYQGDITYRAQGSDSNQYRWTPPNDYRFAILVTPDDKLETGKAVHKITSSLEFGKEYCGILHCVNEPIAKCVVSGKNETIPGMSADLTPEAYQSCVNLILGSVILAPNPIIPIDGLKALEPKGSSGRGGGGYLASQNEYDRLKDRQKWLQEALGASSFIELLSLMPEGDSKTSEPMIFLLRLILGNQNK